MLRAPFALVSLCLGLSFVAAQPPKPAATMDDIKKAWQERQEQLRSVRVEWVDHVTKLKGSMNRTRKGQKNAGDPPLPPIDTLLKNRCSLVIADNLYRYEKDGQAWSYEKTSFQPMRLTDLRNSTSQITYTAVSPNQSYGTAYLHKPDRNSLFLSVASRICSVTTAGRPTRTILSSTSTSSNSPAEGYPCKGVTAIELSQRNRTADQSVSIYLDPAVGFRMLRHVVMSGETQIQFEIEYAGQTGGVGYPKSWQFSRRVRQGSPSEAIRGELISFTSPIATSSTTFDIEFPVGTVVVDETGPTPREHVVRADGQIEVSADHGRLNLRTASIASHRTVGLEALRGPGDGIRDPGSRHRHPVWCPPPSATGSPCSIGVNFVTRSETLYWRTEMKTFAVLCVTTLATLFTVSVAISDPVPADCNTICQMTLDNYVCPIAPFGGYCGEYTETTCALCNGFGQTNCLYAGDPPASTGCIALSRDIDFAEAASCTHCPCTVGGLSMSSVEAWGMGTLFEPDPEPRKVCIYVRFDT